MRCSAPRWASWRSGLRAPPSTLTVSTLTVSAPMSQTAASSPWLRTMPARATPLAARRRRSGRRSLSGHPVPPALAGRAPVRRRCRGLACCPILLRQAESPGRTGLDTVEHRIGPSVCRVDEQPQTSRSPAQLAVGEPGDCYSPPRAGPPSPVSAVPGERVDIPTTAVGPSSPVTSFFPDTCRHPRSRVGRRPPTGAHQDWMVLATSSGQLKVTASSAGSGCR